MFSWFIGSGAGDESAKTNEAQAPGFHPIVVPPSTTATTTTTTSNTAPSASNMANPYAAPGVPITSSPAPLPPIQYISASGSGSFAGGAAPASAPRTSEAASGEMTTAASSSFLFDGMAVGKGRRRRPQVASPTASHNEHHHNEEADKNAVQPCEQPVQGAKLAAPLTSSSPSPSSSPVELRQRLESFYRRYNPAKLSHVEMIMEAYAGREAQLFKELVQRYGPEPVGLSAVHLHTLNTTTATPAGAAPRAESAPSESEVSAFRFISTTAEAAVAAWAAPKDVEEAPSAGGAITMCTSEMKNGDVAHQQQQLPHPSAQPSPSASSASSSNGPQQVTEATSRIPVSSVLQQQEVPNCSLAASSASSLPVAASAAAPAPPASTTNVVEASSHMDKDINDRRPTPTESEAEEEEEEEESIEERQRRELRVSQGALLEARAAFAALLRAAQETLQQRQDKITRIHAVELQIQDCVRAERYREADALSDDVGDLARAVQQCDEVWNGLGRRLSAAQRRLEEAVRQVASLLRVHEVELQAAEEQQQQRVQAQSHHDDADLRLREETVEVRKEDLAAKRSVAEGRLRTARAAQAAVQTRVEATLGTTRAQQTRLTAEVTQLGEQIDALKAQLRQLEAKRTTAQAELAKVSEKIQAAAAAHVSEMDAAAAAVAACERDTQRLEQQWTLLETESAQIANERAAREAASAALVAELQQQHEMREAVHQRTRALEQDAIPASDRYWRAWQDLLAQRLRGADILFEIPAATRPEETFKGAPPALTKKADLQKQLDELAGELHADEELRRDAQRRLAECEARVAPLTATKAAAVASKNFKAAQQCADELKVVQLSREGCQDDVDLYAGQVRALERTMERLRAELAAVEAQTQREAAGFKKSYGAAMAAFAETAAHTPDYVQLPPASQGPDELAEAVRGLWAALQQEWERVDESTASGDGDDNAEQHAGAAVADNNQGQPGAPLDPQKTILTQAEVSSVAAAGDSEASVAALQQRRAALQARLEEAIAQEAYEECESIQQELNEVELQLTQLSPSEVPEVNKDHTTPEAQEA